MGNGQVKMVDVSHHQGKIDWRIMRQQGVEAAYIKVTEDTGHVDTRWIDNFHGATENGIRVGPYHFFISLKGGYGQGLFFRRQYSRVSGWTLPPALDLEDTGPRPGPDELGARIRRAMIAAQAGVIYTNISWWSQCVGRKATWADRYHLWIAAWGALAPLSPLPWDDWTIWQHSVQKVGRKHGASSDYLDLDWLKIGKIGVWDQGGA